MNCKPGDLAVIVSGDESVARSWIGRIVRVTEVGRTSPTVCWRYEGPRFVHPVYGEVLGLCDEFLRPIRDPGDDAVDEMVQKLGKPEGVTA